MHNTPPPPIIIPDSFERHIVMPINSAIKIVPGITTRNSDGFTNSFCGVASVDIGQHTIPNSFLNESSLFAIAAHCIPRVFPQYVKFEVEINGETTNLSEISNLSLLVSPGRFMSEEDGADIAIFGSKEAMEKFYFSPYIMSSEPGNELTLHSRRIADEQDVTNKGYKYLPMSAILTAKNVIHNDFFTMAIISDPDNNLLPGASGSTGISGSELSVISHAISFETCFGKNEENYIKAFSNCFKFVDKRTRINRVDLVRLFSKQNIFDTGIYLNNPEYLYRDLLTPDYKFDKLRQTLHNYLLDKKLIVSGRVTIENLGQAKFLPDQNQ